MRSGKVWKSCCRCSERATECRWAVVKAQFPPVADFVLDKPEVKFAGKIRNDYCYTDKFFFPSAAEGEYSNIKLIRAWAIKESR